MKKCVIIPTYWGPIDGTGEIIFDHPTPLGTEGTLKRLLENLLEFDEIRRGDIKVRIVGVANKRSLRERVENYLRNYIKDYETKMDIKLLSYEWLQNLLERLGPESEHLLDPVGYPQVRNMCLIAALETGSDIGIFLDDDELIVTSNFFKRAEENMLEKAPDEGIIHGKVGYYEQDRPSYARFWELKWWPKDLSFNQAFSNFMNSSFRFKATLIGLGGLMIISRELMKKVCFDPEIKRGEDMDYVFNARLFGYRFYFDKELFIKHLPPDIKTPEWLKARQDILRFLYIRDKYESHFKVDNLQKVALEELLPYPGVFMGDDLEDRIIEYSRMMALKYLSEGDQKGFRECMENAKIPFMHIKKAESAKKYLENVMIWRKITSMVENSVR